MEDRPGILHVVGGAYPGVAQIRIISGLNRRLSQRYRVSALFLQGHRSSTDLLEKAGVEVRTVRFIRKSHMSGALASALFVRSQRPAILHFHVGGLSRRVLPRIVPRAKTVVHLHGAYDDYGTALRIEHTVASADAVIATSRAVAERLHPPARVVYPGHRIDPRAHQPADTDPLTIGTVARLWPVKNLQTFVRAAPQLLERHSDLTLELAGEGPERPRLEALAQELGVSASVRFLGWREPATVLHRWSAFVIPSLQEGFGLAALEAMATGVPVVAAAVGGLCELVDDGVTGFLVPPNDVDALARRMEDLISDPELRKEMSTHSLQRVASHFSETRMVEKIGAIYEEVLGS